MSEPSLADGLFWLILVIVIVACLCAIAAYWEILQIRKRGLRLFNEDDDDEGGNVFQPQPGDEPNGPPNGARMLIPNLNERHKRNNELMVANFRQPHDAAGQVRQSREDVAIDRANRGMLPATFHYQDPSDAMLAHPMFEAIWDEIKLWDVNVATEYTGYTSCTGNHVAAIMLAIFDRIDFEGFDWNKARAKSILRAEAEQAPHVTAPWNRGDTL